LDFGKWGEPAVIVAAIAAIAATISAWNAWKTRRLHENDPAPRADCTVTALVNDAGWHRVDLDLINPSESRWRSTTMEVVRPRCARLLDPYEETRIKGGPRKDVVIATVDTANLSRSIDFPHTLGAEGAVSSLFRHTHRMDRIHDDIRLFVPASPWWRPPRLNVLLRVHLASTDAVQRRTTIDIHRLLKAHAADETAQSSTAKV
jgi:hypothetical protein